MGQHLSRIANCCNGSGADEMEFVHTGNSQAPTMLSPRPDQISFVDPNSVMEGEATSHATAAFGAAGGSSATTMDLQKMAGIADASNMTGMSGSTQANAFTKKLLQFRLFKTLKQA